MVGFLLLSHGDLSIGVLSACDCIMGVPEKTMAITLAIEDDITKFHEQLVETINELDDGDGVLVMVDVLGGTPCNQCSILLKEKKIEILTGLNFPMIVAAYESRIQGNNLQEIKKYCMNWAKEGVISVRERLHLKPL